MGVSHNEPCECGHTPREWHHHHLGKCSHGAYTAQECRCARYVPKVGAADLLRDFAQALAVLPVALVIGMAAMWVLGVPASGPFTKPPDGSGGLDDLLGPRRGVRVGAVAAMRGVSRGRTGLLQSR